jgi:hypothetical protein
MPHYGLVGIIPADSYSTAHSLAPYIPQRNYHLPKNGLLVIESFATFSYNTCKNDGCKQWQKLSRVETL